MTVHSTQCTVQPPRHHTATHSTATAQRYTVQPQHSTAIHSTAPNRHSEQRVRATERSAARSAEQVETNPIAEAKTKQRDTKRQRQRKAALTGFIVCITLSSGGDFGAAGTRLGHPNKNMQKIIDPPVPTPSSLSQISQFAVHEWCTLICITLARASDGGGSRRTPHRAAAGTDNAGDAAGGDASGTVDTGDAYASSMVPIVVGGDGGDDDGDADRGGEEEEVQGGPLQHALRARNMHRRRSGKHCKSWPKSRHHFITCADVQPCLRPTWVIATTHATSPEPP